MSASKWPRIKWNQANVRLANAPFENLFSEQEHKMSALDEVISRAFETQDMADLARAELAQLRTAAAEAQAAHVYLDESPVNDPNDLPLELAERAARLVDEILQLRADLQAAQERSAELEEPLEAFSLAHDLATASIDSPLLVRYSMQLEQRSVEQARQLDAVREIITSCASLDRYVSDGGIEDARVWLAANPAPQVEQP